MSGDVNISTCWRCGDRIHFRGRTWFHKSTGLPYSSIGGDHVAAPQVQAGSWRQIVLAERLC